MLLILGLGGAAAGIPAAADAHDARLVRLMPRAAVTAVPAAADAHDARLLFGASWCA